MNTQIILSAALSCCVLGTSSYLHAAQDQPTVFGDPKLAELVLSSQKSNVARAMSTGRGEIKAKLSSRTIGADGNVLSERKLQLREVWSGDLVFWDFVVTPKNGIKNPPRPGPTFVRMMFDGKEYAQCRPSESGDVSRFGPDQFHNAVPMYSDVEQRPSVRWSKAFGTRTWDELLGPSPKLRREVLNWTFTRNGDTVVIVRTDKGKDGEPSGTAIFTMSLADSGHVSEFHYDSPTERDRSEYVWRTDDNGGTVLKSERHRFQTNGGMILESDLEIILFDPDPIESLRELGFPSKASVERNGLRVSVN